MCAKEGIQISEVIGQPSFARFSPPRLPHVSSFPLFLHFFPFLTAVRSYSKESRPAFSWQDASSALYAYLSLAN